MLMHKLREAVSFWLREAREAGVSTVPPMGDQREPLVCLQLLGSAL